MNTTATQSLIMFATSRTGFLLSNQPATVGERSTTRESLKRKLLAYVSCAAINLSMWRRKFGIKVRASRLEF